MLRISTVFLAASLLMWTDTVPAPAAFPGANGKIVFTEGCLEQPPTWSMNAIQTDGTGEVPLLDGATLAVAEAAWSPDGAKIAFQGSRTDPESGRWRGWRLWVMNADGTHVRRLTHAARFEGEPAWSPDGTRIAYVSGRGSGHRYKLFAIDADGTSRVRITSTPGLYEDPAWSPDASEIVFVTENARGISILGSIEPDGSGLTRLARDRRWIDGPSWAPDGSFILYATYRGIWRYEVATGAPIRILNPDPGDVAFSPTVSPDGARFAFARYWEGEGWSSSLVVADIDGRNQATIHSTEYPCGMDNHLDWQPLT